MFLPMLSRILLHISSLLCFTFMAADIVFPFLGRWLTVADGEKDESDGSALLATSENTIIFVRANYRVCFRYDEADCSSVRSVF